MLKIALGLLAGHIAVLLLPELPGASLWMLTALPVIALLAWLRAYGAVAVIAGAGLAWFAGVTGLAGDIAPELEGEDVLLRCRIDSIPEPTSAGVRFDVEVIAGPTGSPRRARLDWYEAAPDLRAGEEWQLLVRMKRRNGFANPGGFDYEGHLFRSGIGATGYVRASDDNRKLAGAGHSAPLLRIRAFIANRLSEASREHPLAGVIQGLAVGVQHEMSPEQWRVFSITGTTHLMAISGLHIGMVAALFAYLGGWFIRRFVPQGTRLIALHGQAIGGIAAGLGYCALAGMSVPTQRTLIMLIVYFAIRLLRRVIDVPHALSLALIAVLLIDPFAPLAPGAWLSFLAVATILLATTGRGSTPGAVKEFGRVQIAVTLGLLPAVIAAFGTVSLVSPIANAFAVPVFTLVLVPLTLVSTVLAVLSIDVAAVVLTVPLKILELTWWALEAISHWPTATWHMPGLPWWTFALMSVGVVVLLLPGIWPMRIAGILMCLPGFMYVPRHVNEGEARIDVLDVGQGLAAVVTTRTHTLVYDTGPAFRSGRDAAEMVVLPFLWHRGVRHIDTVVVSHGDQDHAGGLRTLRSHLPITRLIASEGEPCVQGDSWTWDGVTFEILHPVAGHTWSDNDSSCVLLVRAGDRTMLFTGDIEADAEDSLAPRVSRVDALTIAHHGSRTSSTQSFVEATRPQIAIASAGYRNRWGFPKEDVVRRWQEHGATVLNTAQTGAVHLQLTSAGVSAVSYRAQARRFWRR